MGDGTRERRGTGTWRPRWPPPRGCAHRRGRPGPGWSSGRHRGRRCPARRRGSCRSAVPGGAALGAVGPTSSANVPAAWPSGSSTVEGDRARGQVAPGGEARRAGRADADPLEVARGSTARPARASTSSQGRRSSTLRFSASTVADPVDLERSSATGGPGRGVRGEELLEVQRALRAARCPSGPRPVDRRSRRAGPRVAAEHEEPVGLVGRPGSSTGPGRSPTCSPTRSMAPGMAALTGRRGPGRSGAGPPRSRTPPSPVGRRPAKATRASISRSTASTAGAVAEAPVDRVLGGDQRTDDLAPLGRLGQVPGEHRGEQAATAVGGGHRHVGERRARRRRRPARVSSVVKLAQRADDPAPSKRARASASGRGAGAGGRPRPRRRGRGTPRAWPRPRRGAPPCDGAYVDTHGGRR